MKFAHESAVSDERESLKQQSLTPLTGTNSAAITRPSSCLKSKTKTLK